jgi:pyrroloquinoline quinone (PQQ) biosynthesis protein C
MRHFLVGVWPVIEQFPQYMAFNLLKVRYGRHPGEDLARAWLIRNLRVEQHHADYWVDWAEASDVSREALITGTDDPATSALAHWCWRTCEREALAISVAATHYAIEGATGEWSNLVCSTDTYANLFAESERKKATRWLRQHAQYDDTHPWEALDIMCTLLGNEPDPAQILPMRTAICTSYRYMAMTLDRCMAMEQPAS